MAVCNRSVKGSDIVEKHQKCLQDWLLVFLGVRVRSMTIALMTSIAATTMDAAAVTLTTPPSSTTACIAAAAAATAAAVMTTANYVGDDDADAQRDHYNHDPNHDNDCYRRSNSCHPYCCFCCCTCSFQSLSVQPEGNFSAGGTFIAGLCGELRSAK